MKLIKKGKVKDIYEVDNENLIFHFTNRVSAFDVIMNEEIPYKGKILCEFALFWFSRLKMSNHFVDRVDIDKILVKKLTMIPIESVVRGYLYGSLFSRYKNSLFNEIPSELISYFTNRNLEIASKLPLLIFDPSTKSDVHDYPINKDEAVKKNFLTSVEFDKIKNFSLNLYDQMEKISNLSDFILADVKYEFGKDPNSGELILADSIGPDECRLWDKKDYKPGKLQDSFDKQILRDWLDKSGFKHLIDQCTKDGKKPEPPLLPIDLINKISERYIEAYERITHSKFIKS
ncbi:MAG TPA: phosphoribosylaminoimidazolesuccinocarboxamide synthase [Verrucomicrobiae bacterium]|nr:phosphoribosylaminoimidazolesuccinocarboxamide synthase [Verrucomicrobiae bacterium]